MDLPRRLGAGGSRLSRRSGSDPRRPAHLLDGVRPARRHLGGRRWSIPGDLATLEADGTIRLLGRGSNCINTAGEKVFPEEVEEALKTHPAVVDAAVVGVPHDRFGQVIVALVEPRCGARPDPEELVVHVKARLAGYKAPKLASVVDSVKRAANGKLDYPRLRQLAIEAWAAAGE